MLELISFSFLIILMLLAASSILYSAVTVGISPMPSSNKAYCAMLKLVAETGNGTIVDLGSGWGNLVIRLAKTYPHREIIGYELSLLPWLTAKLLKYLFGLKNLTLHRQNFFKADLSEAEVIVCYLYPEAMQKISNILRSQKHQTNFLISNNFSLPTWQPHKTIKLNDFYQSTVYLYKTEK